MPEYLVIWEIDGDAAGPVEAAEFALEVQRDPLSLATVFKVIEVGSTRGYGDARPKSWVIDLATTPAEVQED